MQQFGSRWRDLTWRCAVFFCAAIFTANVYAEPLQVSISGKANTDKSDPAYFYEHILRLALEKTRATDGDYLITYNVHSGGIARDRAMLVADAGLHVMWGSATRERQSQMRMVPVDLLKNLNNYRVLLINKNAESLFSRVNTLDDLKKFSVGSGEHWTDGIIFRNNGFKVVVTSSYSGLFKMLAAQRFAFISRGLHEIGSDVTLYKNLGLIQEKRLLIKYDVPVHYTFFVNKNNVMLADRIERGLKIAQLDGSFDKLFYQIPSFKDGEELLKNAHRHIIEIKNTKVK